MDATKILKRGAAVILFFLALVAMLGGYVAAYAFKNNMFTALGIVLGIALLILASMLSNQDF